MKFKTKIVQQGNNTGIHVPDKVIESLGAGKKPPVVITLNGYTYRNTVAVMGGKFMVSLSADNRKKAEVAGGDELEVTIVLDKEPRTVEIPDDLGKALAKNKKASAAFDGLAPSRKKAMVFSILEAKAPETRIRRIEKAISNLLEGKA
jgi:hypothetical protein